MGKMDKGDKLIDLLRKKGALDKSGNLKTSIIFKRNPSLDRVWVPFSAGQTKKGTSVCTDVLIAETMISLLGSRQAYILWVRKAVEHIIKKSAEEGVEGVAGWSRLVQREAISYIRDHAEELKR